MKVLRKAFKQELDQLVSKFVNSIDADRHLIQTDIKGSRAHAKMLAAKGLISKHDANAIDAGLCELAAEYESGELELIADFEDVHMNVEKQLEKKIGSAAARLHTGRSRNDQVALDTRLFVAEKTDSLCESITKLQLGLVEKAQTHIDVVMPGYTHLQRAQPVLFAHALHAFVEMLERDFQRLQDSLKRTKVSPLGAAAFAGSSLDIDPKLSAELLGFDSSFANSIDAVCDRDFVLEFLSAACICATHLSQLAETLIIWASSEFSFIAFKDNVTTASSLMPNKKNPDPVELVRGKTGSIAGELVNVLVTLKALPLGYNRDLQEVKPAIINAYETLSGCLEVMEVVIESLLVKEAEMLQAASDSFLAATDLAEYLVRKGVPFRQAHEAVSEFINHAREREKEPADFTLFELKNFCPEFSADVFELFDPKKSIAQKQSKGSSAKTEAEQALSASLAEAKSRLDKIQAR